MDTLKINQDDIGAQVLLSLKGLIVYYAGAAASGDRPYLPIARIDACAQHQKEHPDLPGRTPAIAIRSSHVSDPSPPNSKAPSHSPDEYPRLLEDQAIPAQHGRRHAKHVEIFIKAQNGHRIKSLSGTDLGYLRVIRNKSGVIEENQFSRRDAEARRTPQFKLFLRLPHAPVSP
jgi:hypothetical protein